MTQNAGDPDYLSLYHLEDHLFGPVHHRWQANGRLDAFDFFCIVIWKANRAKSRVARKLLERGHGNLVSAVPELTMAVASAPEPRERLRVLIQDWGMRLPMASAVLTVLDPEEFTVYDIRVCEVLGRFGGLAERASFDRLWEGYVEFKEAVVQATPEGLSLRDRDRYLWARSFADQLRSQINRGFFPE